MNKRFEFFSFQKKKWKKYEKKLISQNEKKDGTQEAILTNNLLIKIKATMIYE